VEKTTEHKKISCPICGAVFTASTSFEGATPRALDLTVCCDCLAVLQYTNDLSLRLAPQELVTANQEAINNIIERLKGVDNGKFKSYGK
jgi:hypothetical protein